MNSNVRVLCLPYHNTGGHFVDWSLHYLCGNSVEAASLNVDQITNWHHHAVDTARGQDELVKKISHVYPQLHTIYYTVKQVSASIEQLFRLRFEDASSEQIQAAESLAITDYLQGIHECQARDLIPVFLDYDSRDLASIYYNDRFPVDWHGQPSTRNDLMNHYLDVFYPQSRQQFDGEIWDQRELCALTYRPPSPQLPAISDLIDQSRPHLYYTTDDVWHGFDRCVTEICDLWQLTIDRSRWAKWQQIYAQWRTVHDPWFSRHLPRIVDAVINNQYLSLKRFQMNFFMEALLQHELIAKHNLNLKTWQLTHFPDNAQDLHRLLEPSIHTL